MLLPFLLHVRLRLPVIHSLSAFLALVFLATSGAPAAYADLSVSGGTVAQQELLKRAYGVLPTCCRTPRPVCVRLLDQQAMDACLQASAAAHSQRLVNAAAVDGFYQDAAKEITLRTPSLTTDVSATFLHEYGHYLWMNVLSAAQRDQYRTVYKAQQVAGRLVSLYAGVSVEEGFAEAFSYYARDRARLNACDALSCLFLTTSLGAPVSASPAGQ